MRSGKYLLVAWLTLSVCAPAVWADAIGGPAGPAGGTAGGEAPPATTANVTLMTGVPAYEWYHGCGPTAAGMIIGYWDAHGFDRLIPGSNDWDTNRQAIQDVIASPGHVADYALYDGVDDSGWSEPYPDLSELDPLAAHTSDSLADHMLVSWSSEDLMYGWSWWSRQGRGMEMYTVFRWYPSERQDLDFGMGLWDALTAAIDAAEPVELLIDTDGDGSTDHFVVAIGYDDTPGALRYAAYNTWDRDVHWYEYARVAYGQEWGVYGGTFFKPVPEPGAGLVLVVGAAGMIARRRRRRRVAA